MGRRQQGDGNIILLSLQLTLLFASKQTHDLVSIDKMLNVRALIKFIMNEAACRTDDYDQRQDRMNGMSIAIMAESAPYRQTDPENQ